MPHASRERSWNMKVTCLDFSTERALLARKKGRLTIPDKGSIPFIWKGNQRIHLTIFRAWCETLRERQILHKWVMDALVSTESTLKHIRQRGEELQLILRTKSLLVDIDTTNIVLPSNNCFSLLRTWMRIFGGLSLRFQARRAHALRAATYFMFFKTSKIPAWHTIRLFRAFFKDFIIQHTKQ